jgi:AraC-like DNA-binding protein
MKMSATRHDAESCSFSSKNLAAADRIHFFREVVGRMFTRMDIEPTDESFCCNAHFHRARDLRIYRFACSGIRATRTREMAEGCSNLVLAINFEGISAYSQIGREATLSPGHATLISDADACASMRTKSRCLLVLVPRTVLAPMLANVDASYMSVIQGTMEPLRLLTGYIALVIKDPALMETAELQRAAASHIHDLVALTVGATRDAAAIAAAGGLRAARIHALKADIEENLQGDVSTAALSARHGLSPRYIRKLFRGEDTSLSQFVLGRRLARVHRMLADPACADRNISDIAFAVGFGDISTFNRDFRRHFKMTPSDVRAAARDRHHVC